MSVFVSNVLQATAAPTTGEPTPSTTWQWKRAGADIAGATSSSYIVDVADSGQEISVAQTASNVVGIASASSAAVGPVLPFTPEVLFLGGAPGAWYEPSDTATLFQDSAGTTPVTAVEQPVGLMLDKSQGLVLGPELVTNGNGTSTTGWGQLNDAGCSWAVSGGQFVATTVAGGGARLQQTVPVVAGRTYQISVFANSNNNSGQRSFNVWGTNYFSGSLAESPVITNGVYSFIVTATSANLYIQLQASNSGLALTSYFDNVSIKSLAGNHAFQATSASRPVLSARYNLLTKTEQFDDAAWTKQFGSITASNVTAPDGTSTAEVFTPSAQFGNVRQMLATAITVGQVTVSVWLRTQSGTRDLFIRATASGLLYATQVTATTTWTRFTSTFTYDGTNPMNEFVVQDRNASGFVPFEIWGAQLVVTNSLTSNTYQRVNTATDYATTGFLPYLKFDGVDDSLSTNSISFTITDKMSVFAGVRKLSDAARGILAELSPDALTNNGSFLLGAPYNTGSNEFKFYCGGTTRTGVDYLSPGTPTTRVITGLNNIATPVVTIRADGVQAATSSSSQGTGNYGNYPLYIGRRANAGLPFNGQLYSMVIVGKAVNSVELTVTEAYVNQQTGAY
jgi:hypothetical protein